MAASLIIIGKNYFLNNILMGVVQTQSLPPRHTHTQKSFSRNNKLPFNRKKHRAGPDKKRNRAVGRGTVKGEGNENGLSQSGWKKLHVKCST